MSVGNVRNRTPGRPGSDGSAANGLLDLSSFDQPGIAGEEVDQWRAIELEQALYPVAPPLGRVGGQSGQEIPLQLPFSPQPLSLFFDQVVEAVGGEPPLIGKLPEGCSFRPRCGRSDGRAACKAERPSLRGGVACHFAGEV